MPYEQLKYADDILTKLLQLREADKLSINIEDEDFEFARIVAKKACEITSVPVKVLVTSKGKVTDVIDFDPEKDLVEPKGSAFLHIKHIEEVKPLSYEQISKVIALENNFALFHQYGLLAEPHVFDRIITVPWAVVSAFDKYTKPIDEQCIDKIRRKMNELNKSGAQTVTIESFDKSNDKKYSLKLKLLKGAEFFSSLNCLPDGRSYINSTDYEKISINVDCNSAIGEICGETKIFGNREVLNLKFVNGKATDSKTDSIFNSLIKTDEKLSRPGYISFSEKALELHLGGGFPQGLTTGEMPLAYNDCPYSLCLQVIGNFMLE